MSSNKHQNMKIKIRNIGLALENYEHLQLYMSKGFSILIKTCGTDKENRKHLGA